MQSNASSVYIAEFSLYIDKTYNRKHSSLKYGNVFY